MELVAAAIVFAGLLLWGAREWVAQLGCGIPDAAQEGNLGWGADARLIVYVLTWVSRVLASAPTRLFDPPVGYPAPAALTGSEHFLGSQVLFSPLYTLSGNHVFAANVTTLMSYWLSGIMMFIVLRRWRFGFLAAVAGGVTNMFGPLQVPAELHQLQYPAWGLPLVLLAAERVRSTPSTWSAAILSAAITLAALTSYQLAANAMLLTALLVADTALRRRETGLRPAVLQLTSLLVAVVIVAMASTPYLTRLAEPAMRAESNIPPELNAVLLYTLKDMIDLYAVTAAVLALVGWRWLPQNVRRPARLAVLLVGAGGVLVCGWSLRLGDMVIPLPYALLAKVPGSAVINPTRMLVLVGAGLAILVACTVEAVGSLHRLGRRFAIALAMSTVVLLSCVGLGRFTPPRITCLPVGERVAAVYRWLANQGPGAVLDLLPEAPPGLGGNMIAKADAMLASLTHRHPLLGIHTHHEPPASLLVWRLAAGLPSEQTLQALVDMAHLRWVIVPPPSADWPESGWSDLPGVVPAIELADGRVYEVRRDSRFHWFAALSHTPRSGYTLLGTPTGPVPEPQAQVELTVDTVSLPPDQPLRVFVTIENRGSAAWPVAIVPGTPAELAARVELHWEGPTATVQSVEIPYDVEPAERVLLFAVLVAPHQAGKYRLHAAVAHLGEGFPTPSLPVSISVRE